MQQPLKTPTSATSRHLIIHVAALLSAGASGYKRCCISLEHRLLAPLYHLDCQATHPAISTGYSSTRSSSR